MRTLVIAGLMTAGLTGAGHAQDRVVVRGPGASYPPPGAQTSYPPVPMAQAPVAPRAPDLHVAPQPRMGMAPRASRWGSKIDGRWWAGANAPGGYAAYRRPVRGYTVPPYWNASRFYVDDWQTYRLDQPPVGYRWTRYYDDAVLIDQRGSVFDVQSGVDWDGLAMGGGIYASNGDYHQDGGGYTAYPPVTPYPEPRRDNGLGGAAVGAVAGGALGAVVAGRGNRVGGALIGGGVGAATGYLIDRNEDRGRRAPPPPQGYGGGYDGYQTAPYGYGYPTTQTYTVPSGGSHTVFVGPGVTTVTVSTQPVTTTTTTTTEYHDEAVTYSRPAKRVYRTKRLYRSKLRSR